MGYSSHNHRLLSSSSSQSEISVTMTSLTKEERRIRGLHPSSDMRGASSCNRCAVTSPSWFNIHRIAIVALLVSWIGLCIGQLPPPPAGFLDFDNLPVTRFSCEGKVIGGYYADVETGCQMFHVCTLGQKEHDNSHEMPNVDTSMEDEVQDIKFLCLNGTVFDQETRVCERVDEVDCSKAEQFYDLNLDLYVPHVTTSAKPDESTSTSTTTTTTTTTTSTTTTTTTPRPRPRVPSSPSPASPMASNVNINPKSNSNSKGFSSFTYYHQTPTSLVSSGYNSQHRPQSYFVQHNRSPAQQQGRKVPSGPKTILYQSSTSSPLVQSSVPLKRVAVSSTTPAPTPVPHQSAQEQQQQQRQQQQQQMQTIAQTNSQIHQQQHEPPAYDDYYDEDDYASSTTDRQQHASSVQIKSPSVQIPFRDRSNRDSKKVEYVKSTTQSTSSSSSPSSFKSSSPVASNEDDEVEEQQQQQPQEVRSRTISSSSSQTANSKYANRNAGDKKTISISTSSSVNTVNTPVAAIANNNNNSTEEPLYYDEDYDENAEYYDDSGDNINSHVDVNHHFSHRDVPRIPFAKPNQPRVLVTNGKAFLPRIRRSHSQRNLTQR